MRKTKKLRKINKFTNKNKVGGMYSIQVDGITGERHVYGILFDITRSLTGTTHDMEIIKRDVILLINKFKVLNNKDKISFVKDLSRSFNEYHDRNPILIELYYMQIMTLIDATLTMSVFKPRSIILAKLSNDTMRMIAAACMTMSPEVPPQEMPPQDMLSHVMPPQVMPPQVMPPQVMPPQVMPIQEMPIQESEPIERPRQRRRLSSSIPPIGIS